MQTKRRWTTDAQEVVTAVLHAEARLGELLKSSSKGTFKKGGEKSPPEGIDKKQSHYAQALLTAKAYSNKFLTSDIVFDSIRSWVNLKSFLRALKMTLLMSDSKRYAN
jgi:hypothetical protein